MTYMKFLMGALAVATLTFSLPKPAEAKVNVFFNSGPSCQQYTRNYIDYRGFQRQAIGTACLQPNGTWQTVSENPGVIVAPTYYTRPVAYYPAYPTYYRGYNRGWDRDDRRDNRNDHHDHDRRDNNGRDHR